MSVPGISTEPLSAFDLSKWEPKFGMGYEVRPTSGPFKGKFGRVEEIRIKREGIEYLIAGLSQRQQWFDQDELRPSHEWQEGDEVSLFGKIVKVVRFGNNQLGVPHRTKCRRTGCKCYESGYLTQGAGGGAFYDKAGNLKADLRNQEYACRKHRG